MNWYDKDITIAQVPNGQELQVSGPGIDLLVQAVSMMFSRGAPREWDDAGFNKPDYDNPFLRAVGDAGRSGATLPVSVVNHSVQALGKYQATQLTDYAGMRQAVIADIAAAEQAAGVQREQIPEGDENKVRFIGQGNDGKLEFYIRNFRAKVAINRAVRQRMEEIGGTEYEPQQDRYGNFRSPAFKGFSPSKDRRLDHYEVHPRFIGVVADVLETKGYDVSDMRAIAAPAAAETPAEGEAVQPGEAAQQAPAIALRPLRSVQLNGSRLDINFGTYIPEANDYIKQLPAARMCPNPRVDQCRDYSRSGNDHIWTIVNPRRDYVLGLTQLIGDRFDVAELEQIAATLPEEQAAPEGADQDVTIEDGEEGEGEQPLVSLEVTDISDATNGEWHMAIGYKGRGDPAAEGLKDALKFSFLRFAVGDEQNPNRRNEEDANGRYVAQVSGDYRDYIDFYNSLRNRGFDVTELAGIIRNLIAKGLVQPTRKPGELDGFESPEQFYGELEKYESNFGYQLKDEQKQGIGFLYGRESAILGDATGAGKTVQTAVAADMRMNQDGGRTVVITKKNAKPQWSGEIKKIMGLDENDVSNDPAAKKRWTVMHYDMFSVPSMRERVTNELKQQAQDGEIQCLILDESHSVKNVSQRTKNVSEFSSYIPFVWGATATAVSNKPRDLKLQLRAINHKMGLMSDNRFKSEFEGVKWERGQFGSKEVEGTFEERFEAANKLKQAMIDQSVYIKRSKEDMRADMPEQNIDLESVEFDEAQKGQLYRSIGERMAEYKKPDMAVSAMLAFRTEVAIAKAPISASMAAEVLDQGKKVAVFTDFNDSRKDIMGNIQAHLDASGGGRVATIAGGMKDKDREDAIMSFKDPNSDTRAIVINFVAGGTGLDFPNVVTDVINNDFDWSVGIDDQALGRFFRINSQEDVNVRYAIAKDTEDVAFYQRLKDKKEIAEVVRDLSGEQMSMMLRGLRHGRSKELAEVEDRLLAATRRAEQLEAEDARINSQQVASIMGNVQQAQYTDPGEEFTTTSSKNWYKKGEAVIKRLIKH